MSESKHALAIRVLEDLRRGYLAISQSLTHSAGSRSRYRDDAALLLVSIDALKEDQKPSDWDISLKVGQIRSTRERETGELYRDAPVHFLACSAGDQEVALGGRGLHAAVEYLVEHRLTQHAGEDPLDFAAVPLPS